jgi:hypothetical protein
MLDALCINVACEPVSVESLGPGRAMRAVGLGGYLPVEAAKPATSGFQSTTAFKPLTSFESGTREQFACIKL